MTLAHWPRCIAWASAFAFVVALATPAAAQQYRHASAGVACQPANGALSAKFTYNLHYLTNTGTTDQTVVCSLPMDDAGLETSLSYLQVSAFAPTTGTTVTCLVQTGHYDVELGRAVIESSSAATHTTTAPNESFFLAWDPAQLSRSHPLVILVMNCKLPPGGRLGSIGRAE